MAGGWVTPYSLRTFNGFCEKQKTNSGYVGEDFYNEKEIALKR